MANPYRGETSFDVGGKTYTLQFNSNACAELEDLLARGIVSIVQEIMSWSTEPERISLKLFRALLWAGLRKHHRGMTVEMAGDLLDEAGGMLALMPPVSEAFSKTWPESDKAEPVSGGPINGSGIGSASVVTS